MKSSWLKPLAGIADAEPEIIGNQKLIRTEAALKKLSHRYAHWHPFLNEGLRLREVPIDELGVRDVISSSRNVNRP